MFLIEPHKVLLSRLMTRGLRPLAEALGLLSGTLPVLGPPRLITAGDLAELLMEHHGDPLLRGAAMDFSGPIGGRGLFFGTRSDYRVLTSLLLDPALGPVDGALREDACQELADILLHAVLTGFTALFSCELKTRPARAFYAEALPVLGGVRESAALRPLIYVSVGLEAGGRLVRAGIALDMISLHSLAICLDDHLQRRGDQLLTA